MKALFVILMLTGCGYHWAAQNEPLPRVTIHFIGGDEQGTLTSDISAALADAGVARIVSQDPEYRLHVSILKQNNETIGFRRDPQKVHGKVRKNLLACEGRRLLEAEVILYRRETDEIARGPFHVKADAEYDYVDGDSLQDLVFLTESGQPVTVLPFSLGQLESTETAQEAASRTLYRALAKKIVDVISSEW